MGADFLAFAVTVPILAVGLSLFTSAGLERGSAFRVLRLDDRAEQGSGITSSASSASGIYSWGNLQGPLAY